MTHGAHEERAIGAQAVERSLGPRRRHRGEHPQRPAPILQEQVLDRRRRGKRRLDHRAGLRVEGVRLHVARRVEVQVEASQRGITLTEHRVHRRATGERVAAEQRSIALPGAQRRLDQRTLLGAVGCDQVQRVDRQQVRVVAVRLLPRPAAAHHQPAGIGGKGREVREHVAPTIEQRLVEPQILGARDQRLETPREQRQVVIRVGHRGELRRLRGRQMPAPVLASLHVGEVVPDRALEQRVDPLAQHAVVHLVAIVEPVVIQGPWQVPHLVSRVALRRGEIDRAHEIRTRAASDRRRVRPQPLGHVVDEGLPVPVQVSEQGLGQVEPVRPEQRRVGELDVQVPPDAGPGRGVEPGAVQVEDRSVGTHRRAELVDLDPVVRLETGVGEGEEALGIVRVPPPAMRRFEPRHTLPHGLGRRSARVRQRLRTSVPRSDTDVEDPG